MIHINSTISDKVLKKIIIEKLSYISISEIENDYELVDELRDKKYVINHVLKNMCELIEGKKSLFEIIILMAEYYGINKEDIKSDIYDIYIFMRKNKIIIVKNTLTYFLLKIYYKISIIKV